MGNGLECRSQDSQVIHNQACRFRNFFLGPIPELCSARSSPHFQEVQKTMSIQLTQHNLLHFQETQQIMSTKTQTWHSWQSSGMGPRKKFRNLQAWLGMTWLSCDLHISTFQAIDQVLPTPGGHDSGRLGLSVRTWLAKAATAADLKRGSGLAGVAQEKV